MAVRLAIVALGLVVVVGVTLAYRRRRRADEARGAIDPATGQALWPALPDDLHPDHRPTWVVLSTPVCASCRAVKAAIVEAYPHHHVVKVDLTERPQLGDHYDVRRAPTTIVADADGRVVERLVGAEAALHYIGVGGEPALAAG